MKNGYRAESPDLFYLKKVQYLQTGKPNNIG